MMLLVGCLSQGCGGSSSTENVDLVLRLEELRRFTSMPYDRISERSFPEALLRALPSVAIDAGYTFNVVCKDVQTDPILAVQDTQGRTVYDMRQYDFVEAISSSNGQSKLLNYISISDEDEAFIDLSIFLLLLERVVCRSGQPALSGSFPVGSVEHMKGVIADILLPHLEADLAKHGAEIKSGRPQVERTASHTIIVTLFTIDDFIGVQKQQFVYTTKHGQFFAHKAAAEPISQILWSIP